MNENNVRKALIEVICESTETEVEVTFETSFQEELGLSSMEIYLLIGDLETEFDINIPIERLNEVETVEDLFQIIKDEL